MKITAILLLMILPFFSKAQIADSSRRLVHLQGAVNFRDAGGYMTQDGKLVVWGRIFRSADISKLSEADLDTVAGKHIHTVIDFRGVKESAAAPDRLLPGTHYTLCPAGSDSIPGMKAMMELIKKGGFIESSYGSQSVPFFGPRYRPLFQQLLSLPDTTALLYHCTGGRDRTGMATALLLYALGVPQQKIEEDFVASNYYLQQHGQTYSKMAQAMGMSEEEVEKELSLRPELIRSFFKAIDEKYGSVENFMKVELGIGPKERALLQKKYTI